MFGSGSGLGLISRYTKAFFLFKITDVKSIGQSHKVKCKMLIQVDWAWHWSD